MSEHKPSSPDASQRTKIQRGTDMIKPTCSDCGQPIERGPYRDPLWIKLWSMRTHEPIYYHIGCWNKRVADELRWEDSAIAEAIGAPSNLK